ncbi:MAG: glycosyltransferase [Desulfobacteraceae bacterium]|nr:glycosyltransferase [Desulfobacteraceae bacterium]
MENKATFNILMYSHDTYGLGHIRRTMAIAEHLSCPDTNILILTGSPLAGRFTFPRGVDHVRIPGMIKRANEDYFPLSIRIDPRHALEIRKSIILATAQTFRPDLFIVDKEPLGLKREVLSTLQWMSSHPAKCLTVLGLRDVMDDAETVRRNWREKGVYENVEKLYSEVWVYGEKALYDPVVEYAIPRGIAGKLTFTGYIPRKIPGPDEVREIRKGLDIAPEERLVTVTTGGGGDGLWVLESYLAMLETMAGSSDTPSFRSVLITGPFLSEDDKRVVLERARVLGVIVYQFFTHMEALFSASDLVVCMGGYNTVCEILTQQTPSLVIPRETPRKEQLIRAMAMKKRGLLDYIPWGEVSPDLLEKKIHGILGHPGPFRKAMAGFELTGINRICSRISTFKERIMP